MAASGTGQRKTYFEPHAPGFLKTFPPTFFRERLPESTSWEECNRFSAQQFEDIIINEGANTIAGIIVEPIGNTGGLITPTDEYFTMLRDICDRHKVLLIFDETITGFCKTGHMFGGQSFGVDPDIIVCGKGLSNGVVPLAAMIAREDMGQAFKDHDAFAHGHTFANNPLACAVGSAVLKEMVDGQLHLHALEMGSIMEERMKDLKQRYSCIDELRGKGMLRGVTLQREDGNGKWPELGNALKRTALQNGLIMRIDPTWFTLCPALCATETDIHELFDLVEGSLKDALSDARAA